MRRLCQVALLGALALASAQAVQANTIGLTPAMIDQFIFNPGGSSIPLPDSTTPNGGGRYTTSWCGVASCGGPVSGPVVANWRLTGISLGLAGDTFILPLTNTNENIWSFSVSINGGAPLGPVALNPPPPAPGQTHLFTFLGIAGPVTQVDVFVSATLPLPVTDRTSEFDVAAVPEPGSMILLGSGLLGLAGAVRRRIRR